jgi:DNA-binding NarL/FixJ family response regulator
VFPLDEISGICCIAPDRTFRRNSWQSCSLPVDPIIVPGLGVMATRILIADDDDSIRLLLRRLLEEHADWQVCGEAANGHEAIARAADLDPDVVILDLAMPHMNGFQAAQEICMRRPHVPMLLLTVQEVSAELAREAQRVGFRGAVSKSRGTEVVLGVEALLQEKSFFAAVR